MRLLIGCLMLVACAAHPGDPGAIDAGSSRDGGTSAASWSAPVVIDADPGSGLDLSAAVDHQGHAAVAYFTKTAPARFQLVVARSKGAGDWSREVVAIPASASDLPGLPQLTGHYGLSLAFDADGQPALAFLGGGNAVNKPMGDGRWTNFDTGEPLPSSAVIMRKTSSGWTSTTVAASSGDIVSTGYAVDDTGVVTGLWAALAFDATGAAHAFFRDLHFGSDDSATRVSNLEYLQESSGGAKSAGELVAGGRGDPMGLAGAAAYTRATIVNGAPAVSFVLSPDSTDAAEQVWFAHRTGPAQWSKTMVSSAKGRAGQAPSLTAASDGSLAIAFYDSDQGDLLVARSSDGDQWTTDTLEALGDTGQHPAAAFDSDGHLGVLYAFCRAPTDPVGRCSSSSELRFRLGSADADRLAGGVPETTALMVDGAGRFVAVYKAPGGGLQVVTRSR